MNRLTFDPYEALKSLVELTAPHTGDDFLRAVCFELKKLFKADLVFITRAMDRHPTTQVKVLHSTSELVPKKFILEGTPCKLVYDNKIIAIHENVRHDFEKEKETQFESFYGVPLHNEHNECIGHIAIFSNIKRFFEKELEDIALIFARKIEAETKRALLERRNEQIRRRLERLSIIDPLTQVYNRRFFTQKCTEVFNQIKRENIHASIIYLDLDDFKHINDTYGHDMGDYVLKTFAKILKRQSRKGCDFAARLGGEEFGVISLYSTIEESKLFAQRINQAIYEHFQHDKLYVTASIGISCFSKECNCWEDVFSKADENMYKAKRLGKNTIVV